uniref:Uncharacterized protein n=1 Tax=Arundo donax TaxID=35708 RepID=A0A0A9A2U9_ARUDO
MSLHVNDGNICSSREKLKAGNWWQPMHTRKIKTK